jgi:hypothetical protein
MLKNIIISSIIFATSLSAWAAPQTYKVTARVTNVYESRFGALPAPLHIDDEVTMTYVLDDAKSPDFQDNWNIAYSFDKYQGSMKVSWSYVTLKTSASESSTVVRHHIGVDANNGNGVQEYFVESLGPIVDGNGNFALDVYNIKLVLHSDGPLHQTYTPWLTPDLNKFTWKQLQVNAGEYLIAADVTSIVKEGDQPFAVWPEHGTMHISQQFDVFVTAPAGYNYIEFVTDPMAPPLPISCEIVPNINGQTEIKFLCRDLNAGNLQLFLANYTGVTIRLKNLATDQSLERVMNWRMVD